MSDHVAVVGPASASGPELAAAHEVGRLLATAGAVVICGGLSGVMDAAARGCREAGGMAIGILPGETRDGASPHLAASIPTGMGEARNALVARAADAVIAIGGEFGTLSEIALALKMGRPVVGLRTWSLEREGQANDPIIRAETPEEAVDKALGAIGRP